MKIVKVTRRGQTTIPIEFRGLLGIKEGDELLVEIREGGIFLRPLPRLEELAGIDSDYGDVEELKKEIEELREEY